VLTLTTLPPEARKVLRATGITVDILHYVDSSTCRKCRVVRPQARIPEARAHPRSLSRRR
jgi:hypothetical protein